MELFCEKRNRNNKKVSWEKKREKNKDGINEKRVYDQIPPNIHSMPDELESPEVEAGECEEGFCGAIDCGGR